MQFAIPSTSNNALIIGVKILSEYAKDINRSCMPLPALEDFTESM
jgi:hypothetical protein